MTKTLLKQKIYVIQLFNIKNNKMNFKSHVTRNFSKFQNI